MKILTIVLFAFISYGLVRFMLGLINELAEIASEAWHSGETDS
jgi:hypothetical protein